MSDGRLISMDGNDPMIPVGASRTQDGLTLLAEFADAVRANWQTLGLILGLAVIAGLAHSFVATPTYLTDALVKVEARIQEVGGPFSDYESSRQLYEALIDEITIMRSRSILGNVVDELRLDVVASPVYFGLIGKSIARWRGADGKLKSPLFDLEQYAWSNESIKIDELEIPNEFRGESFRIVAEGNDAFAVYDVEGNRIADGTIGESIDGWLPTKERSSIAISELIGAPGTAFNFRVTSRQEAIESISESLSIADAGLDSSILKISMIGSDPKQIQVIVNEVVDSYVEQSVETQSDDAMRTLRFVEEQIPLAKNRLEKAEAQLADMQLKRGSVDLASDSQAILDKIVRLESEISNLERARVDVIERFTEQHPRVQSLDLQLDGLNRELAVAELDVKGLPTTQRELLSLSRDVSTASSLYISLVNRAQELQVVSAYAAATKNVSIVDRANRPELPFRPKKALLMVVYSLLGISVCVGVILLQKYFRDFVTDPEVVETRLGLPIYATLRHSNNQEGLQNKSSSENLLPLLAVSNPNDPAVEGLRSLRTSLQFAFINAPNNVLLITGPTPRVGKTFVSSNLAAVLAAGDRRVVVVDADLRRGTLHEQLGVSKEPGLADAIAGDLELTKVLQQTRVDNLTVVTAGHTPPNPSELLMHKRFEEHIQMLSKHFDHVIVDSPPVLSVTDAVIMSRLAAVVLLVVKCGAHSLREIEQSVRLFRRVGANVRGVVFNGMPALTVSAYGYESYEEYTSMEKPRRKASS